MTKITPEEENFSAIIFLAMLEGLDFMQSEGDEIMIEHGDVIAGMMGRDPDSITREMSEGSKLQEHLELIALMHRIVKPEYHHVMDHLIANHVKS